MSLELSEKGEVARKGAKFVKEKGMTEMVLVGSNQ